MVSQAGTVVECWILLRDQNNVKLSFTKLSYSFPDGVFNRSDVPIEVNSYLLQDLSMQLNFDLLYCF